MAASQSLPDLISAAHMTVKSSYEQMSEIRANAVDQELTDAQTHELATHTQTIELAAIDIFAVFEARMQRHFKRGPLSRKVKAALLDAKKPDLADRLHQHYLAINVLKHGAGASHRELLGNKSTLFVVKQVSENTTTEGEASTGLIDVTAPQFFEGLAKTLHEAHDFLESR